MKKKIQRLSNHLRLYTYPFARIIDNLWLKDFISCPISRTSLTRLKGTWTLTKRNKAWANKVYLVRQHQPPSTLSYCLNSFTSFRKRGKDWQNNPNAATESGLNENVERDFPGVQVRYGERANFGGSGRRKILPDEGGDFDARGRWVWSILLQRLPHICIKFLDTDCTSLGLEWPKQRISKGRMDRRTRSKWPRNDGRETTECQYKGRIINVIVVFCEASICAIQILDNGNSIHV